MLTNTKCPSPCQGAGGPLEGHGSGAAAGAAGTAAWHHAAAQEEGAAIPGWVAGVGGSPALGGANNGLFPSASSCFGHSVPLLYGSVAAECAWPLGSSAVARQPWRVDGRGSGWLRRGELACREMTCSLLPGATQLAHTWLLLTRYNCDIPPVQVQQAQVPSHPWQQQQQHSRPSCRQPSSRSRRSSRSWRRRGPQQAQLRRGRSSRNPSCRSCQTSLSRQVSQFDALGVLH